MTEPVRFLLSRVPGLIGASVCPGDQARPGTSLLRTINQLLRNILIEYPAQYPLAAAIAKFHRQWQAGCKLCNAVIQKWHAPFQAYRHSRSVEFDQDIVWKISHSIEKHHLHAEVAELGPYTALVKQ